MDAFTVTFFTGKSAATLTSRQMTLEDIRDLALTTTAISKAALPWLKLATFGDKRTAGNSLRHNKNVLAITGIELDYDGEVMPVSAAVEIIQRSILNALVYTSPSHAPEKPRFRLLLPTSSELPPVERVKLVTRVNGLFGGIFSGESFTLSQAYYIGGVVGRAPVEAFIVRGDFIDARPDLDATAIGKVKGEGKPKVQQTPERFEAHLARLGNGEGLDGFHRPLLSAVASYVATHGDGFDRKALMLRLREAIDHAPMAGPHPYLDGDKHLIDMIDSAVEKYCKGDEDVKRMNESHAVLPIGDKTRVVTFGELQDFPGRETIVMTQTLPDFRSLKNKYRHSYKNDKGEHKTVPLGTHWLASQHRRQYDGGMAFMPESDERVVGNKLNLWHDFGVQPRKPSGRSGAEGSRKFLKFWHKVICSGDDEHFDYARKREATILQKRIRTEIALAMHSEEEGVGKGFFEKHMGHLLGHHAMQVTNPRHVIGNFNPHLESLLRLTADEALFVNNHEHRNSLFGLITEPRLTIEPKNCSVYTAKNHLNISLLSNSAHFVPVSGTARRFLVLTVSAEHMQDFEYFRAVEDQLVNDGGYEALLYHLLHEVDLSCFDVRKVPRTAALVEQAAYGRRGIEGLVEMVCNEARVPCEHPQWPGFTITTGDIDRAGFYYFINSQKDRSLQGTALTVIRRLQKDWGCSAGTRRREPGTDGRTRGFQWPPLAELRERFERQFGKQNWMSASTEWSVAEKEVPRAMAAESPRDMDIPF